MFKLISKLSCNILRTILFLILLTTTKGLTQNPLTPRKVALMSTVAPGLGQITNKKYWKLPIVYAGLGASAGLFVYQHLNYKKFKNAYIDLEKKETISSELAQYSANQIYDIQNSYRSSRDLFGLVFIGVYAMQILDAYVDRHFINFKISDDFEASLQPSFKQINAANTIGISVSLNLK